MMNKRSTGICIAALVTIFSAIGANAQTPVDLKVNNNIIKMDSAPYSDNGTALVPLRRTAEALGCGIIEWNESRRTAFVSNGSTDIEFYTGSKTARVSGKNKTMPSAAVIVNGRTYVSARFLAETLGAKVTWNEKTHTVEITKKNHTVKTKYIEDSYTAEDLDWLAKIVHAEAQGETHDGKIAVANVVLNRRDSKDFPNTIYDVIFDEENGVQFTPVANGAIYNNPSIDSYHAAKQALFGANTAGKSLYFCNPVISTNFWIMNNRKLYANIGNHDFYL